MMHKELCTHTICTYSTNYLLQVCRKFILGSDDAPETRLPITEKNIIRPGIPVKIKFSDL